MPPGLYAQEKACKQEEKLISKLQAIELDARLIAVLRREVDLLLEGLCTNIMYNLVRILS